MNITKFEDLSESGFLSDETILLKKMDSEMFYDALTDLETVEEDSEIDSNLGLFVSWGIDDSSGEDEYISPANHGCS